MPLTADERLVEARRLYGETGPRIIEQVPALMDLEIMNGVQFPHPSLSAAYESGCAEPWTSQLIASLLIASNKRRVLETGGFTGQTSAWLAMALERLGGGTLTVVDIDAGRVGRIQERLAGLGLTCVATPVIHSDILAYLPTIANESVDFAWIDDNHEKTHVETEVRLLWPKMAHGGILTFHDVWGSCDLQSVVRKYGGVALDLPRLGAAGGVGIIQRP